MNKQQLTFADIAVGQWFYMDFAGQNNVRFEKTGPTSCTTPKLNGPGVVDIQKASPLWEVKNFAQMQDEQCRRSNFQQQQEQMRRVPGHSSTYPYGEH